MVVGVTEGKQRINVSDRHKHEHNADMKNATPPVTESRARDLLRFCGGVGECYEPLPNYTILIRNGPIGFAYYALDKN